MTVKSRAGSLAGTSTGQTQELLSASIQSRIALALLVQAVQDLAGKDIKLRAQSAHWLNSPGAKEVCEVLAIPYQELWDDIRDITFRASVAQRVHLARQLIKSFPKI